MKLFIRTTHNAWVHIAIAVVVVRIVESIKRGEIKSQGRVVEFHLLRLLLLPLLLLRGEQEIAIEKDGVGILIELIKIRLQPL